MRKALGLLLACALAVSACGDDDSGGLTDPADADSCEELAEVTLNLLQEAIDAVEGMSISEFIEMSDSQDLPAEFARIETIGGQIEERADLLGCSEQESQDLVCDRIDELSADSEVARLILAGITSEC